MSKQTDSINDQIRKWNIHCPSKPNAEEKQLREAIVDWLNRPLQGVFIAQVNQTWGQPQNTASTSGFPDLVVMSNGKVDLWELKRPKSRRARAGQPSPDQLNFIAQAAACGVDVQIIRSFEEAVERLRVLAAP